MQDHPTDDVKQLFSLLIDSLPVGIAVIDCDMRLQYINQRHAQANHLSVSDHIGKQIADFLPQAAEVVESKIRFVIQTGIPLLKQEIRASQPSPDGHFLHRIASYLPWRASNGQMKGVLALIQDSTLDDVAQQLIEDSQHRLLKVLDNLYAFVGVMELDGTITHANRAPLEAAGLSLDDVRGKKVWDSYWFSYNPDVQQQLRRDTERCCLGEVVRYDVQVRMMDGKLMWIDFMLAPLKDKHGQVTHLIPSAMDISQRHAGEVLLQQSEERFRSIVESSDDAIITKTLTGIITGWNPAAERLLGYTEAQALGQPVGMLFPEDRVMEEAHIMRKISAGEQVPSFETERIHKNGRLVSVAVTISPLRDRRGAVVGACKLARDVSAQKQQRALLEHALEEKTALLHEVHHRVKNNLQIVSSLLNLQARKVSADAALALGECQGRIRAMSLVHQLLYESSSMSEVDLSDYISRLIALTRATYDATTSGVTLLFFGSAEKITLDIQRAIPCGLVVNELVLNAMKHAFVQGQPGCITVKMVLTPEGLLQLSVSDDGCGLPAGFVWGARGGLGTQLIPLFVNQLNGHLTTQSSDAGACFTLELRPGGQKVSYED